MAILHNEAVHNNVSNEQNFKLLKSLNNLKPSPYCDLSFFSSQPEATTTQSVSMVVVPPASKSYSAGIIAEQQGSLYEPDYCHTFHLSSLGEAEVFFVRKLRS